MKKIYISEEQTKHLKKAIAAQDQVGGKVNAGIMDAVAGGEGAMCEQINKFNGQDFTAKTIAFISIPGDSTVYSSSQYGQRHQELLNDLFNNGKLEYFYFGLRNNRALENINGYQTGRYWVDFNTITFWQTPARKGNRAMLRNTVEQLGLDKETLDVDFWDTAAQTNNQITSDCVLPYKWFFNGTFDDLLEHYGAYKIQKHNNSVYCVLTTRHGVLMIDRDGNIVRNLYESTGDIGEEMIYQHGSTPHKEIPNFKPNIQPLTMYKQFKLRLDKNGNNLAPGYVFPLYVNTEDGFSGKDSKGLEIGKWYKSGEGECWLNTENNRLYTKGKGYGTDGNTIEKLAYRPGWHLTTTPWGNQRGDNKVVGGLKGTGNNYLNTRNSEVWAKVEVCVDIDATERARSMSATPADQCLQSLGDREYYKYKTNSNASDDQAWYIVDMIRIVEVLDDDTVDSTNDSYYAKLLADNPNKKINSDPYTYTKDLVNDIPYWKMPRTNGKRYSKADIESMGYKAAEPTRINERKKVIKNDEGETVPETCDKCGGKVVLQIHGEPVYVCKDCGKYFGTMPFPKNLNENHEWCDTFKYTPYLKSIANFLQTNGIEVKPFPRVKLHREEQEGLYVKTGYYDPEESKVHLFITDRHPKDVLRSFTHEMIHHSQNLRGDLKGYKGDTLDGDDVLQKLESEAYLKGNIYFRKWTEELRPEIPNVKTKKKLNESIQDIYNMQEDFDEFGVSSLLSEFFRDKKRGITKKQWDLIPAQQYQNLLTRYMQDPITARIPDNIVYDWFEKVVKNAFDIEYITELPGHSQYFPYEEVQEEFDYWIGDKYEITDYMSGYEALEAEGFYDWCSLPDGSDGWSDYGIEPIFNELSHYKPNMPAGDLLVLINRVLHIGHCRGDLASAFIEGGSRSCSEISGIVREGFDIGEITKPEEVDLSSFELNNELNPRFWKNGRLDSRVRVALLNIADDFIETLDVSWAKPVDVIMTGSLANYNWSEKHSDVDLHVVMDFKDVDEKVGLVKDYFDSKRKLWNDEHQNITIAGYQVELYVQDINEPHTSSGVYSLERDKWIVKPNHNNFDMNYDETEIKKKVSDYMNEIDELCDEYEDSVADCDLSELHSKAEDLFKRIKNERRRGFELGGGEYNPGNLIFKTLRRNNYIEKINKLRTDTYDDIKSVLDENTQKDV